MGKGAEGNAASWGGENEGLRSPCEAHHVAIGTSENCGGTAGAVGEDTGGEEEGGVGRPPVTGSCFHRHWPIVLFTDAAPVDRV